MKKSLLLRRLEFLNWRRGLNNDRKKQLEQLQRGHLGEVYFEEVLKSYSDKQWTILSDLNLKTVIGYVQIDFLLLTNREIYIFEVKNYAFNCLVRNNRWFFENKQSLSTNVSQQVQNAALHIRKIFDKELQPPTIHPCIIYAHPNYSAKMLSEPEEIILNAAQIPLFLGEIATNHQMTKTNYYSKKIKEFLNPEAELFFMEEVSVDDNIRRGIYCAACQKFSPLQNYRSVVCKLCGHIESKGDCIKRLAEEYCTLYLTREITSRELAAFSDFYFSKKQIRHHLPSLLTKVKDGRAATYRNPLFELKSNSQLIKGPNHLS